MSAIELRAYELFKTRFSEEEAKVVFEYIEAKAEEKYQLHKDSLATKADIANSKVDLIKWMVGFFVAQMAAIIGLYMRH